MSPLRELISKGVRLVGMPSGDPATTASPERVLPPEAFAVGSPPALSRSAVPVDVADWNAVYREAGLQPPAHGYGVDKVAEMLESKRLAPLAREVKRTAVLAALEAAGVSIRDVIQDAVMRDHALEAFETLKQREVQDLRARTDARIQTIQQEMETVLRERNSELEGLKRATEEGARAFAQFQNRKRREEERLHEMLSHFLKDAENPIPLSGAGETPPKA